MRIRAESSSPVKKRTAVLCAFCFEDNTTPIGIGKLQKKLDEAVLQSTKEIKGKKNKIAIIHSHKEIKFIPFNFGEMFFSKLTFFENFDSRIRKEK